MSTSQVFAVRTAAKTLFTTALAGTSVQVIGGPLSITPGKDAIYVGVDDLSDDIAWITAVDASQQWHANISRLEDGELRCVALTWSGASDFETAFTSVQTYMALIERALLTDPGLANSVASCGLSINTVEQINSTNGLAVKTRFSLIYQARIA